jgi:TonB family protein
MKKNSLSLLFIFALSLFLLQACSLFKKQQVEENVAEEEDAIFSSTEESPEFPGGIDAMMKYISSHIEYPKQELEEEIEGMVYTQFVVEKDGSLSQFKTLKGVSENLDKEAIRVLKSMPKWTPGKQRGKAVRSLYIVPVRFEID